MNKEVDFLMIENHFKQISKIILSINNILNQNHLFFLNYSHTRVNPDYISTCIKIFMDENVPVDSFIKELFFDYRDFIIDHGIVELLPCIYEQSNEEIERCVKNRIRLKLLAELEIKTDNTQISSINPKNNNIYIVFAAYIANNLLKKRGLCNVLSEKVKNFFLQNDHIVNNLKPVTLYLGFIVPDGSFLTNISNIINSLMNRENGLSNSMGSRQYSHTFMEYSESKHNSDEFTMVDDNQNQGNDSNKSMVWSFKNFVNSIIGWNPPKPPKPDPKKLSK